MNRHKYFPAFVNNISVKDIYLHDVSQNGSPYVKIPSAYVNDGNNGIRLSVSPYGKDENGNAKLDNNFYTKREYKGVPLKNFSPLECKISLDRVNKSLSNKSIDCTITIMHNPIDFLNRNSDDLYKMKFDVEKAKSNYMNKFIKENGRTAAEKIFGKDEVNWNDQKNKSSMNKEINY